MNYSLEICKRKSKEKGTEFCALVVNFGYTCKYLTCSLTEIAEYLGVSVVELYATVSKMSLNDSIKVGSVLINKEK